jgi:hypothetical protein
MSTWEKTKYLTFLSFSYNLKRIEIKTHHFSFRVSNNMSEIAKKCHLCYDYWYDSYMSLFIGFRSIDTCLVSRAINPSILAIGRVESGRVNLTKKLSGHESGSGQSDLGWFGFCVEYYWVFFGF